MPFSRRLAVGSDALLEKAPTLHALLEHLAEAFGVQPVREAQRSLGHWMKWAQASTGAAYGLGRL